MGGIHPLPCPLPFTLECPVNVSHWSNPTRDERAETIHTMHRGQSSWNKEQGREVQDVSGRGELRITSKSNSHSFCLQALQELD